MIIKLEYYDYKTYSVGYSESSRVSAWEIRKLRKKSYQRYLVFDQIESQRLIETEKFIISLYQENEFQGGKS